MKQIIYTLMAYLFAFTLTCAAQTQRPVVVTNGGTYIAEPTNDLTWLFQYIKLEVFLYPPGNVQRITGTIEHTMGEGEFEITLGEQVTNSTITPTSTQISFNIEITPDPSQQRTDLFSAKPVLDPSIRRPGSNMYPYALQTWKSFAFFDPDGNQIYGDSHANPIRGSGDQPVHIKMIFDGFPDEVEMMYQIAIQENEIYPPWVVYNKEINDDLLYRDRSFLGEETFLIRLVNGNEYTVTKDLTYAFSEVVFSPNSSAESWEIYD